MKYGEADPDRLTPARVRRGLRNLRGRTGRPVLLTAGAPVRRRDLRYVQRDAAPPLLDRGRGESASTG
ncbi:hypothetical protein GCM10010347_42040 [Streptomyces cirratus]|uniref:Uncharacterized protein n=1 Tax=Streptomyces cirratus TaxID=68187 RepID=A0ABQ3F362_9ACTN|nr:hypothetical protein GCM10010347_42040 [Streptomyces cirratus]